eukprot:TRINITY_DN8694_c0_g1_i1.p1 TRINITY_DN8694_c0_g1~~TRINITY_DN8694_c0_g1_i1.p1  ORF type:complete len:1787 (-),score=592.36 TRINITY_DN8694_c0_g1_i1:377-5737(-)
MSQIPKVKTSLPKPSLSQIATATGSQLDLYAGRVNQTPKVPEPTESFKIGDKIWVGGTKQGTVKYIGDTKFAPGEWAGVELDEAQGKNDGSVGGEVYFSCPPNHGVFSRCNRLSRKQSVVAAETVSSLRKQSRVSGALQSPSGSISDLRRGSVSPTLSPAESTCSLANTPLEEGDRVIVASSMAGTKTGTLRYLGPTDFAKGEWAGVELDAAIGKNDGSVDGKRYFQCDANFGLFAPIHKVTKSPKMKMMKPSAITPKLRRESSNLSDVSINSSAMKSFRTPQRKPSMTGSAVGLVTPATVKLNTTALKDQLKEKDQHIEQLLKEREMERAEVAKAASQTDEAETKLLLLKQEFDAYKQQNKGGSDEEEVSQLKDFLEEEKRKNEDLQFRLEEEEILRTEGNKSTDEVEENMKALRTKIISLEEGSLELKEQKETVEKELSAEKSQIEHLEKENASLQNTAKQKGELQDKLNKLNKELLQEQKRCENFESEANKVFEAEEQLMVVNEELSIAKKKLEEADANYEREKKQKDELMTGQKTQDVSVSEKIIQFENESRAKESEILELKHELEKYKSLSEDSETKYTNSVGELNTMKKMHQELIVESEKQQTEINEKQENIKEISDKLQELKTQLTSVESSKEAETIKVKELELLVNNKEKENNVLKDQLDQTGSDSQKELQERCEEVSNLKVKLNTQETQMESLKNEIVTKNDSIQEITSNLSISEKNIATLSEIKSSLEKEVNALKDSTKNATSEVSRLIDGSNKKDEDISSLNLTIKNLNSENEGLQSNIKTSEIKQKEDLENNSNGYEEQISSLNKSIKQIEKDTEASKKEFATSKAKWEATQKELEETHESTLNKLNKSIQAKETKIDELEERIKTLREESVSSESNSDNILNELQKLEEKLKTSAVEHEKETNELNMKISEKQKDAEQVVENKTKLETEIKALKIVEQKYSDLSIELKDMQEKNVSLKEEKQTLDTQMKDLLSNSNNSSEQLEKLSEDNTRLSSELTEIKEQKSESNQKILKMQNQLDQLRSTSAKELESIQQESQKEVAKLNEQLELTSKENEENTKSKHDIIEQQNKAMDVLRKSMNEIKAEKENIIINHDNEVSKIKMEIQKMEDSIVEKDERIESLQWKKDDMEKQLEKLKEGHEEEMGEMVDVVNDLKIKEDELVSIEKDMKTKTNKIDELCKQLLQQEQSHKEFIRKKDSQLEEEIKSMETKIEEAKSQSVFLKDQMGNMKVESDLQIQKIKMEFEVEMNNLTGALDQKSALVDKLKDDLGNKESELEFVKEDLQNKKEELEDIASDLDIKEASFSNEFKDFEEKHQEEVEELITKNESLGSTISTLKETIAKQTAEFDSKMDEILKNKKTDINNMKDQLSEKEIVVMDLQASIKTLEEKMHNLESTMEGEATLASTKIEKISGENEALRRSKYELENSVKNVSLEKDHIIHLNEDLSIRIVEFEVQVKEMRSQYESLQMEYQKQTFALKERTEKANLDNGSLADLQKLLDNERFRVDELQVSLNDVEAERDQLSKNASSLESQNNELSRVNEDNENLRFEVVELTKKNEFLFAEIAKERLRLESKIETLAESLEEKKKDYSIKEFEVSQLQSENSDLTSYKRQVLMLEQEKRDIESQLIQVAAESRMRATKSPSPAYTTDSNQNEGDDGFKMQIEFLNSVIVDMQRKCDKLSTKLELYETAGILDESVEFMFNGVSSRAIPPRLFCDICDEFDLHDTEDCPTQATPVVDQTAHTKKGGKRGVERPYCDTCEIFGHKSEDCNDNETF